MKRIASFIMVMALLFSMLRVVYAAESAKSVEVLSLPDEPVTKDGYIFEYTAAADGTLNVELGNSSPACRYFYGSSLTFTYTSNSYEITAGHYIFIIFTCKITLNMLIFIGDIQKRRLGRLISVTRSKRERRGESRLRALSGFLP